MPGTWRIANRAITGLVIRYPVLAQLSGLPRLRVHRGALAPAGRRADTARKQGRGGVGAAAVAAEAREPAKGQTGCLRAARGTALRPRNISRDPPLRTLTLRDQFLRKHLSHGGLGTYNSQISVRFTGAISHVRSLKYFSQVMVSAGLIKKLPNSPVLRAYLV